ncbi:RNA polymerase sigma-70 factor [Fulvivirgaceae bacterium BMA12]|uniref:RNA polymerase sigma-70 factor n=1 Tax=Agaribacillus aureus TaxID=3051825 RepID=A0ABT8L6Q6_9BACT|nr:RNA polymerase sigma-70 factor [Fulvivirgaceae bacterium BMA12]
MMQESAFEHLFKTHHAFLCNVAYSVVKDKDEAKDVVQQVFLKLWQSKTEIQSAKSYLHRAVVNAAINHLDKNKNTVKVELPENMASVNEDGQGVALKALADIVLAEVRKLPPKCQTVFSLSRYEGLNNQEIADYMDISVKTVENQMGKALKILRQAVKDRRGVIFETLILICMILYAFFNY